MSIIDDSQNILKKLEQILPDDRYRHTVAVADTAAALAMRFGMDVDKAYLSGALHDCAKFRHGEELIEICDRDGVTLTEEDRKSPAIVHQILGAYLAEHEYGITDPLVLEGVRYHTTAHSGMSDFSKLIFIADYIEPTRARISGLDEARLLAFTDLDKALVFILDNNIRYLNSAGRYIHKDTLEAFEYYRRTQNG